MYVRRKTRLCGVLPEKSLYYELWKNILSYIKPKWRIMDVGCGWGQFAKMATDAGHEYVGLDFNELALEHAEIMAPEAIFHLCNVELNQSIIAKGEYEVITFIEFLEHVEKDKLILESVVKGKNVILSVPNFRSKFHLRVFESHESIKQRYGEILEIDEIKEIKFRGRAKAHIALGIRV